jgi:hypothetical protein
MATPEVRREQMLDLARRWRESGVKARTFADEHGVTAWTLYYWRQRLDGAHRRRRRSTPRTTLAPVHVVTDPVPRPDGLEILLASGDRLCASADVSAETLRGGLRVLCARC